MASLYFNLDGTLVDHRIDYEAIYDEAVQAADLDALSSDYEDYTDAFFDYFQNGWTFPRRQAVLAVMKDHGIEDLGQSDRFAEAWEDGEADRVSLREGARETLEALDGEHALGVVTNGTGRLQRMKLERTGIRDLFDAVVISSEIGVTKPHSDFFETAREALQDEPHVLVSQELRRDVLPAKRLDFTTVWLSAEEGDPQVEDLVDARIATIADLPAALDRLA